MAGKKDKKANKDEKNSSLLPKMIGGIKVPKDARRQLSDLAKHPAIADLIAAGLVALANRIKPPAPAEPAPAPEPAPAAEAPPPPPPPPPAAKPVVKRVRKPASVATPAEPAPAPASAPAAKAPPPRRGRKAADAPAKRARRTPPKTEG